MASAFQIPGNIKQQFLPFVLNPVSDLNKNAESSTDPKLKKVGAQYFSFRNRDKSKYNSGFGRLQVCPSSMTDAVFGGYLNKDVSFQSLYGELGKKNRNKTPLTIDDLFNAVPGIQIREFLPDTRLDSCINFFGDMLDAVKDMFTDSQEKSSNTGAKMAKEKEEIKQQEKANQVGFFKKIKMVLKHAFDYMTGVSEPNNLYVKDGKSKFLGNGSSLYSKNKLDNYILNFPYTLYYRLQSCITTNVYELPCRPDGDQLYSAKGNTGWTGGSNSIGITNTFIGKIPILGDILKSVLGNVRINFMPWWDSEKGSATAPPEVSIKFDLFNDTADAAMMNFIFVNTVVPNNMWIQYNMFQHSSCLYDIKIEGYNRLFACAGSFDVKAKGVLRNPPPEWIDKLCSEHANGGRGGKDAGGNVNASALADSIKKNNLIKIPDIYEVTMKFESLLPQNFNTFLYTYSQNNTMETKYRSGNIYQESMFNTVLKAATTDFGEEMIKYWKDDARIQSDIVKAEAEDKKRQEEEKKREEAANSPFA